jgi:hypothetical protein
MFSLFAGESIVIEASDKSVILTTHRIMKQEQSSKNS